MSQQQADPAYIQKVLDYLCEPGQVVELRAMSGDRRGTISGYFDDLGKMASEAAKLSGTVPAVYFTPNPVKAAMLSRAVNRLRERVKDGDTTGDQHIAKRTKFLLDFDSTPEGVSGISSTDTGHEAAIKRAREAKEWLEKELGFPSLLLADSANGAHLMGELDLENNAENAELLKKCLEAVALRFEDEEIKVDQKVFNAARIWKLYGTWACKGDETEDRHHRLANIISGPKPKLGPISPIEIVRLAALAPQSPKPEFQSHKEDFDINAWIAKSGLDISLSAAWQVTGWKWILKVCPWNSDHTNRSAYIMRLPNGAISAGCHHNGCTGKGWHDLRDIVEPGWRKKNQASRRTERPEQAEMWPEFLTAKDILQAPKDPTRWILDGCLPVSGGSVVVAKPKVGKSTTIVDLCMSVARGEPFLGRVTQQCPVAYLFLDGSLPEIADVFVSFGLRESDPIYLHAGSAPGNSIDWLLATIKGKGVRLVVIDTLQKLLRFKDINDYAEVTNKMEPLLDAARQGNCHIMMLHHAGKYSVDDLDAAVGSTAIRGLCYTYLFLKRLPNSERRIISSDQRGGKKFPEMAIGLNRLTGRVEIKGTMEDAEMDEAEPKIMEFLNSTETGEATEREIRDGVPMRGIIVSKALRRMHKGGNVERTGEGKKNRPFRYSPAPDLTLRQQSLGGCSENHSDDSLPNPKRGILKGENDSLSHIYSIGATNPGKNRDRECKNPEKRLENIETILGPRHAGRERDTNRRKRHLGTRIRNGGTRIRNRR